MSDITRRRMLGLLAATPLAAALDLAPAHARPLLAAAARAADDSAASGAPYAPKFFTPHEWRTVRLLADLVIPRDARSGSATDAGVPEFMDVILQERTGAQTPMRGGLRWLDAEMERRAGTRFADATPAQQAALLDDIAWPKRAAAEMRPGAAFFSDFRDLVASGFWTTKMGIADLQFIGNVANPHWDGCPPEALAKLGVSYAGWREPDEEPGR